MINSTVLVTGNTYPVKDSLKAMGGRWDAANKGWRVPTAKAAEAQALVTGAPRSAPRAVSTYRRSAPRGRCGSREDEPRDSDCASCRHDNE
jgi:hypothetical protein